MNNNNNIVFKSQGCGFEVVGYPVFMPALTTGLGLLKFNFLAVLINY